MSDSQTYKFPGIAFPITFSQWERMYEDYIEGWLLQNLDKESAYMKCAYKEINNDLKLYTKNSDHGSNENSEDRQETD